MSSQSPELGNELAERAESGQRGWVAAALAGAVLLAVSVAKWNGFPFPQYLEAVIFQSGALALFLVWAWPRRLPVALRPAAYLFCAYAAFSVVSSLWAPETRLAAIGSLPMLFGVTWALALGHLLSDRRQIRLVLRTMFAAGTLAALAGLLYVLRACLENWAGQVHGLRDFFRLLWQSDYLLDAVVGQRNFLATFLLPPLVMGLADLLTPLITRPARRGATLALPAAALWPCLLLMLGIFALCRSWGALLGLGVGLTCFLAAQLSSRARWALVIGVAGLALAGIICLSLPGAQARLMQSHQATRWFMWQGALRMILERPICGWGSGMFLLHFSEFKPIGPMQFGWLTDITIYPHDELLLVAVEGGIIALGLYLAGHFFAVREPLRKAQAEDVPLRIASWAVFGAFLAMFAHGLVEVSLRFWAPAAAYWTLLGVMIAAGRSETPAPSGARRGSPAEGWLLFGTASVTVIAVAVGVVYSGARAEWLLRGASNKPGTTAKDVIRNDLDAVRYSRYLRDYLVALEWCAKAEWDAGNNDGAIAEYEKIEHQAPGYGSVRLALATLYRNQANKIGPFNREAATADLKKAAEWIKLAIRQDPYDVDARLLYAELLATASDRNLPAAIDELRAAVKADQAQSAVKSKPERPELRYSLARLLARSGQKQEALAVLDEAAALCAPGDPWAAKIAKLRDQIATP